MEIRSSSMSDTDWPAAHSMDTQWYAMDKCGHVGVFYSSESGALPDGVDTDSSGGLRGGIGEYASPSDLVDKASAVDLVEMVEDMIRRKSQGRRERGRMAGEDRMDHIALASMEARGSAPEAIEAVLLLDPRKKTGVKEEFFARLLMKKDKEYGARLVRLEKKEILVVVGTVETTLIKELHDNGSCTMCIWDSVDIPKGCLQGAFYFRHPSSNGAPYPYNRLFSPKNPVTWKEMGLAEPLKVQFPFCFGEKKVLQPASYLKCDLYGDAEESVVPEKEALEVDPY